MTTRVFLVDDHEVVRRGLRELLDAEEDLNVVGEAGTAAETRALVLATHPDVAILDVRLPDGDGVEVARELRSALPELKCLMLTSYADDEAMFSAILAGASGYVLKEVRGNELVTSVRRVAAGESLLDPAQTRRLVDRLATQKVEDKRLANLSGQQARVLQFIVEGKTNRQIAETMGLAERTVKNYVSQVFVKTGFTGRTEAAIHVARLSERQHRS